MPNTVIMHPTNGTCFFGMVAEKKMRNIIIPGAPIVLKRGRHSKSDGGFGVRHIWARHSAEMLKCGYETEADVAKYVAAIVCPGAPIYCEFAHMRGVKVTVVRTAIGMAVLEHKVHRDDAHYSIVTAFAQRNPQGVRIGSISAMPPSAP